jgi:hypothetical protein
MTRWRNGDDACVRFRPARGVPLTTDNGAKRTPSLSTAPQAEGRAVEVVECSFEARTAKILNLNMLAASLAEGQGANAPV